jgi:hypothetical protein
MTYDGIYRLMNETVANDSSRANGSVKIQFACAAALPGSLKATCS